MRTTYFSSCEAQFDACFEFVKSRFAEEWRLNGRRYDDVAEFEQEMTRDRLADVQAAYKRRGRRVADVVPYGYEADPATKQLVIVPQESRRNTDWIETAAVSATSVR